MWKDIKANVLVPLLGRIGTLVTGFMIANGMDATYSDHVVMAVIGCGLVAADLLVGWYGRQRLRK